ncbi:MAG: hypothetical protein QG591_51 [Planctomycetota bacterium]|jgi:hypothetical protein|nr:hypothetical protein [Planctomycetota bacterium]
MARQNEFMFSGLERELKLYMGEEYEAPRGFTIRVLDTTGTPMFFQFGAYNQYTKGVLLSISEHTYKKKTGLITKTYPVPGVTQTYNVLWKKGDTTVLGHMDYLQFNENYDASKPESSINLRFNVIKQNALTQFEILESKSAFKISVFVNGKWMSTEYPIQEPVVQKIEEFKAFISGLQLEVFPEKYFEEYELAPDGNSYWIRARGSEGGTSDIKLTIDSSGKSGNISMNILTPDDKKKDGAVNENVVNIVSRTGRDIAGEVKRWPLKIADVRMEILTSGIPTIRLKVTLNKDVVAKTAIDTIAAVLKIEAKDIDKTYEIIGRNSLTPAQEAQGLIDFISTKTKPGTKELEFKDEEYDYEDEYDNELEYELDDDEFEFEYEYEGDDEPDEEFEFEHELNVLEDDGVTENFARRLYELSTRSYESEYELDEELDRALNAVEDEFMVKRMHRKKKRGKRKGLFKKILSAGAKIVGKIASKTPIGSLIKAGTSLVRGNVKGALGNLAKAAVGAVLPPGVGTVATASMDALGGGEEGGEGGEEGEIRRGGRKSRAIRKVARIARDAYREVADTLPNNFDHPLVANEVARKAVQKAMIKNGVRPPGKADGIPQHKRIIKLRPGEKVVIIG